MKTATCPWVFVLLSVAATGCPTRVVYYDAGTDAGGTRSGKAGNAGVGGPSGAAGGPAGAGGTDTGGTGDGQAGSAGNAGSSGNTAGGTAGHGQTGGSLGSGGTGGRAHTGGSPGSGGNGTGGMGGANATGGAGGAPGPCTGNAGCPGAFCNLTTHQCVASQCQDGAQDGAETDIDCGGGTCPKCDVTKMCSADTDCKTSNCSRLYCALVSGPPNWLPGPSLNEGRGLFVAGVAIGSGNWKILALGADDYADNLGATDPAPFDHELLDGSTSPLQWHIGTNGEPFDYMNQMPGTPVTDASGDLLIFYQNETWLFPVQGILQKLSTVMPTPCIGAGATLAQNGLVYVIGGTGPGGGACPVQGYNPVTDKWVTGLSTEPPVGGNASAGNLSAATGPDGIIYVFSGANSTSFEAYDPENDTWSSRSALPSPDSYMTVVTGADGRIYGLGGQSATVNAFTPATNRWTPVAPLSDSRYGVGTAVTPDGHIWAIGGTTDILGPGESVVQIYGPAVTTTPRAGQPGSTVSISGSNFAPNANVSAYFQSMAGQPAGSGSTDGSGALTAAISVKVPNLAAGNVPLIVMDDRSRYPITLQFQVQ